MLALKNVLAEQERVGTLVFVEVGTGVSVGGAKGGGELAQVSRHKQVLCVTHYLSWQLWRTLTSVERGSAGQNFTEVVKLTASAHGELARLTGAAR